MNRSDKKNSVLVIQNGIGHGLLTQLSVCTSDVIKNYVLKGKPPQDGTECNPNKKIFE
jgi:hypothetical protein